MSRLIDADEVLKHLEQLRIQFNNGTIKSGAEKGFPLRLACAAIATLAGYEDRAEWVKKLTNSTEENG